MMEFILFLWMVVAFILGMFFMAFLFTLRGFKESFEEEVVQEIMKSKRQEGLIP